MDERRGQQHAPRSLEEPDMSTQPTRQLLQHGAPRLQSAEAYEREAAKLQTLAQQLEGNLWACSEALEEAREREQQLQATANAARSPDAPLAHRHDLEQARLDIESYATVIRQLREDYLALMRQADDFLAAASILRGVEHEEPASQEE